MTDCRDAGGTPMDSTVGRGEAIGVPAASLHQTSDTVINVRLRTSQLLPQLFSYDELEPGPNVVDSADFYVNESQGQGGSADIIFANISGDFGRFLWP